MMKVRGDVMRALLLAFVVTCGLVSGAQAQCYLHILSLRECAQSVQPCGDDESPGGCDAGAAAGICGDVRAGLRRTGAMLSAMGRAAGPAAGLGAPGRAPPLSP